MDWYDWDEWWFDVGKYGRNRPWLPSAMERDHRIIKGNIGCGTLVFNPGNGWVNLDQYPDPDNGVGYMDITMTPFDFDDDYFDYIFLSNILEHIPDTVPELEGECWYHIIEELLRVTKPGGFWEIHGPDPRDAIYTLQVGGHTRLVGPHTFEHLTIRYKHGAMKTTALHDNFGLEMVDYRAYSRFHIGKTITDWHLRRYLGRKIGDIAAKIVGKPGQIRMVFKVVKGDRDV
jgi:hypothetical protein